MNRFETICQETEASSYQKIQYFCMKEGTIQNRLEGVFVQAKTSCGALLQLFRYMKRNDIPQIYGPMYGKPVKSPEDLLLGYDYDPEDSTDVIDICAEWSRDELIVVSQIIRLSWIGPV